MFSPGVDFENNKIKEPHENNNRQYKKDKKTYKKIEECTVL
jgi:hypothetical protein